jgi:protein ImuA
MQMIAAHGGQLQVLNSREVISAKEFGFTTTLSALDVVAGAKAFARGAVHEILCAKGQGPAMFFATMLARAAGGERAIVWSDPEGRLYPPAIAAAGIPLSRLLLLRPKNQADELWALTECLRCSGVGVALACPKHLSTIEARRLQLAAERGGGVGILLRPHSARCTPYAAATRWLVSSLSGERTVQKWKVQLIHGHGGQVGKTVILEACRETNSVRALETVADRPVFAKKIRSA